MKFLKAGLSLALLGTGLAFVPGAPVANAEPAAAKAGDNGLVQKMRGEAYGTVRLSTERATGKVSFARATGTGADLMPDLPGATKAQAVKKADAYLADYAKAFGAPSDQLVQSDTSTTPYGHTVRYVQTYRGVPVFGGALNAHVDSEGDLTAVNGELVPVPGLDTTPRLSVQEAGRRATALVKAQPPTSEDGKTHLEGLAPKTAALVVYKRGLVQGLEDGETVLAYQVEVTNGTTVRDMVFIDADTGKSVNRYSMMADALERELYETSPDTEPVFEEGDPFPGSLNADQQNLVQSTGEIYWLYKNTFNRDSYTGEGTTMKTVNNDPRINCPNANWNGATANYCDGVTSDDVVSHEWTHAYTEYTHGLIYQWQSGALNEGYSDVFGETLDLLNGREDEGEGDINAKRPVGLCSSHSAAKPVVTINSPSDIARDCLTGGASYGAQLDGTGITGDVVIPTDAVEAGGGTATDGCSDYNEDVTGKIVMVDRGLCTFVEKSQKAEAEGAAALIIGNRDDSPISPSGDVDISIPTVTIGLTDREAIRSAVTAGDAVNVTMKDAGGDRFDSYRWLIGEKSPAFGGAIRDMWNPTCYGDPGKVSDVEYKCSTDDNGGVHGNSGVVNHGYALLVDGGTFNGVSVTGIGLDKALNIYYRAMTEYQTPVSNFVDHADSLIASCGDLVNKQFKRVEIGGPGGSYDPVVSKRLISADDCAQVAAMTDAVELRLDPTDQCAWEPMFVPGSGSPVACDADGEAISLLADDFENGLDNWSLSAENPNGGLTEEWKVVDEQEYLGTHSGRVAYGPAPDRGVCGGGKQDFSSVDYMTSPEIHVPANATQPRMSWEHSVASELGYDGGTVQVSVDGADWETVPADAYTFNGPDELASAVDNTNPLAGQPGFTGTDPNKSFAEWGTSQVDLSMLATPVAAGETVQVRYAIGRDGCGGNEGWYVDNVALVVCVDDAPSVTAQRHEPEPSMVGESSSITVLVTGSTADVVVTLAGEEIGRAPAPAAPGGYVEVELPATLPAGEHELTVTSGSASDTITITIEKVASAFAAFQRTPEPSTYGEASVLEMLLESETATGSVSVSVGGKVIGTGTVEDGYAAVDLPSSLPAGKHTLSVTYAGDASNSTASDTVGIVINKAASATKVASFKKQVKKGRKGTVRVKVTSAAGTPDGKVVLKSGARTIGQGTLKNGVVTIKTSVLKKVGKVKVVATYQGAANYGTSKAAQIVIKVVK